MNSDEPVVLAETKYLRLIQDQHWTYAQRPNNIGAVAIIAVTEDDHVLLIQQYRIPVAADVIELPAGLVGDESDRSSETLEEAAHRELLDETGYEAREFEVALEGASSAGLTDERVHLLVARDVVRVGDGGGDHTEEITVHRVPISEVSDWIDQQRSSGRLIDFKVLAGIMLLQR